MDLTVSIQSQLDLARAHIDQLKSQLEHERRMRKKAESMQSCLRQEALEERERCEATERVCKELAREIATDKAVIEQMKKEMEEERRMWRVAEVWREERVRMKLSEAKILMEERVLKDRVGEVGMGNFGSKSCRSSNVHDSNRNHTRVKDLTRSKSQRIGSPERENPHIKRGIKGFVEFPRVVRAVGSRGRQRKLECQKAQLRLFLRHKTAGGGLAIAGAPDNLDLLVG